MSLLLLSKTLQTGKMSLKCPFQISNAEFGPHTAMTRFAFFHVEQPVFRKNMRYIILARNPLKRTISAFNWRYKLVVVTEEQRHSDPGEFEALTQYGSINVLSEALYDDDGIPRHEAIKAMRTIGHIRMDISFYLTNLLDRCRPDQIEAVLMQETLNQDIAKVFGINNEYQIHENSDMRDPPLSPKARKNLMRFLHRDYEALARLYAWVRSIQVHS